MAVNSGLIPSWNLMRNCLMAFSHRFRSMNFTAIKSSQSSPTINQKPKDNI